MENTRTLVITFDKRDIINSDLDSNLAFITLRLNDTGSKKRFAASLKHEELYLGKRINIRDATLYVGQRGGMELAK